MMVLSLYVNIIHIIQFQINMMLQGYTSGKSRRNQGFSEIIVGDIVAKSPHEVSRSTVASPLLKVHQRGVQWKQGVVIYMLLVIY